MKAKVHGFKMTEPGRMTVVTLAPLGVWADWFDVPVDLDTANEILNQWPAAEVEITITAVQS